MVVVRTWSWTAIFALAVFGCRTSQFASSTPKSPTLIAGACANPATAAHDWGNEQAPKAVALVAAVDFQESLPQPSGDSFSSGQQELIGEVLSREWLAAEIEARNPSLEAKIAAWQAATQLYPQRIALDDPMLMGMIAPESAGSAVTETAYAFQLNQKLPWFGKRRLRGAMADADADAAFNDAEDSRLQLRLASDLAFYEYFLAARLLEINRESTRIIQQSRETAQSRYRANQVTQQDVLQGDLELAELARRQLELERMQQVAIARINMLLRRWPDSPLPLPPPSLESTREPADANLLWQTALRQRPDIASLAWRVQSEEAALELAYKNHYPDFDTFGRYDTFWQPSSTQGPLRAQVGVAVNVPIWREKLRAAVCEAQFRLNQRRAEFEQRALDIQYEVVAAAKQVEESHKTAELYAVRLVPVADQNVAAARSNYEVGKQSFIDLALAQRQLVSIHEKQLDAIVNYHRRLAELDRAVGGLAPSPVPSSR